MIYASGVATLLLGQTQFKSLKKFKHQMITLDIKEEQYTRQLNEIQMRLTVDFSAILPRSYECRSLEDYTGKVKPFLQHAVNQQIISVQIKHLNYLSDRAIRAMHAKKNK